MSLFYNILQHIRQASIYTFIRILLYIYFKWCIHCNIENVTYVFADAHTHTFFTSLYLPLVKHLRSLPTIFKTIFHSLTELVVDAPDCSQVMLRGHRTSGVYNVVLRDGVSVIKVYCEISTEESWLVSGTIHLYIHRYMFMRACTSAFIKI